MYFAEICFEKFGDRVKYWATINEPGLFVNRAYIWGTYPPGHCSKPFGNCSSGNSDIEPLIAIHNMLLSHSMAVHLYRKQYQVIFSGQQPTKVLIYCFCHYYTIRKMLTNTFKVLVNNLFKKSFYRKKQKKTINILTIFFTSYNTNGSC